MIDPSTGRPFYGSALKLRRAELHTRTLNDAVHRFFRDNPNKVVLEPQSEPAEYIVRADVFGMLPVVEWGVLIGDVVHNLHSALDQMVWNLTDRYCGPAPPEPIPRNSPWRRVGFPIVLEKRHWGDAAHKIIGVGPRLSAEFYALQPFLAGEGDLARRHPLAVLHELWNRDKHRTVNLTNSYVKLFSLLLPEPLTFRTLKQHPFGPVEDYAELARILVIGPPGYEDREVEVDFRFAFDITFEEGPPAYGGRLGRTLADLHKEVARILWHFETRLGGHQTALPSSRG